jgi:putative tryptophan/tyrosine transport system substrate-binding protein
VRRRQVIAGVAALVVVPRQSAAQRAAAKIPRVGVLTPADSADTAIFDAFRAGLRDLGYVEGHNLILEFRLAHGDAAVLPKLAADLASVPVDVILADGEAVRVAMAATKQIPIVMAGGREAIRWRSASQRAWPAQAAT